MGWPLWSLPSVLPTRSSEVSTPSPLKYLGVVGSKSTPCSTSATSTVDPRLAVEIHRPPRDLPKLADSQLRVRIYLFFYNPLSHLSSTPCLSSFPQMGLRQHKMCLDVVTTRSTSVERTSVIFLNSNLSLAIYSLPQWPRLMFSHKKNSNQILFINIQITPIMEHWIVFFKMDSYPYSSPKMYATSNATLFLHTSTPTGTHS